MAVTVQFDPALSAMTGGASETSVSGSTVRDGLVQVARAFPALRLVNCDGEIRTILQVKRHGETVSLDAPIADGDTLLLTLK